MLVLAFARTSLALGTETETEPIRIDYRADPGAQCPSEQAFAEQVFARTQAARPASESETARTFVVELRKKGARVAGTLAIEETGGASMARHVTGSECGHVASVLALAIALAIDPRAELAPRQELEPVAPAAPEPAPPTPPPATAVIPRERGHGPWSARASLGASAAFGVAPQPSLGPSALFGLRHDHALLRELGLGFVFRTGAPEFVQGARADFRFYAGRATLCVRGVELAASFHAGPCLVFEAGGVTGAGSELPQSSRATRFWAAAEALLQLEQGLPGGFFVTLEGGAVLPFTRYRFVFENPDTPVHDVPVLAAEAGLRVGVRLFR